MSSTPNTMPYEFRKVVKAVATTVSAVEDEELTRAVSEELNVKDPENAEEILKESMNGTKQANRIRKENSKQSSEKEHV